MWPPLYARLLTLTGIGGEEPRLWLAELAQIALLALAAYCLAVFARRRGLPPAIAVAVGAALFVLPSTAAYAHLFWPEAAHVACLLGALLLAERATLPRAATAGLLLGLALLLKSLLTPLLPVIVAFAAWSAPRRRWAVAATLAGAMALTLAPTLWRNYQATGRATIADSSTFNLWLGLNDAGRNGQRGSQAWGEFLRYRDSAPDPAGRDAALRARIDAHVAERGWVAVVVGQLSKQYFRLFDRETSLTEQLPGGAFHEAGQGFLGTPAWLASAVRGVNGLGHALLLASLGCGLAWAGWPRRDDPGRNDPWSWWAPLFLGYHLALFLFLHAKSRYLVQLTPFLLLWAGAAWQQDLRTLPRWRLVLGVVLALLLLVLGFGGPIFDARLAPAG
jgi:uncharacterized membrane protein YqjE